MGEMLGNCLMGMHYMVGDHFLMFAQADEGKMSWVVLVAITVLEAQTGGRGGIPPSQDSAGTTGLNVCSWI